MFKHPLLLSIFFLTASLHIQAQDIGAYENNLPFTGAVKASKVRMRVAPNLDGHVVRETANGEMFIVTSEINDYYSIIPPKDAKGFVFRTFILDGTVEAERVNVRLYPDIDAPVVGQFNTGDKVTCVVSDVNNKWLEVNLPENSRFYIAKEYIEHKGPVELFAATEKKRAEAIHCLSAASLFAQAEIQKPFEQIDLERVTERFHQIERDYHELPSIVAQVREATQVIQDVYVQKKIAFIEGKTSFGRAGLEKLSQYNEEGTTATIFDEQDVTDKMNAWQPLEESFYHLWVAVNGEKGLNEFYADAEQSATVLTGVVEPYTRPVKNRPGDFILKVGSLPVAFLYSTRVNLEKMVGQKITVLATPRPNHNFAFPAYFVISVE